MKFNININFFALFRQITPAIFARPLANSPDHLEVGVCQDHLRAGPVFQGCFKGNVPWKTMVSPWKNMVIWLRIKWCVLVYHWLSHIFGVNILIHIEVLTILQDIHVLFHACGHGTWWIHGNFPAHFCHRSTRCLQPPTGLALVFVILDGAPGIRIVLTTQLNGWNLFQEGKEINNKWYWYKWVSPIINV